MLKLPATLLVLTALAGTAQERQAGAEQAATAFRRGEQALRGGDLDGAEQAFHEGLKLAPRDVGAHVNLGVVHMRRKQWAAALRAFEEAQRLAPEHPGISLNIGLAYYRLNNFQAAIAPFEAVLRRQPESRQAAYLVGISRFLTEDYAGALKRLEPLWSEQSNNMQYLYVLGIAAGETQRPDLEKRAFESLLARDGAAPEMHLLRGKAYLAREEFDAALRELRTAAEAGLPFANFYLGAAWRKMGENGKAAEAFLRDAALEPDLAFNYEQLGEISLAEDDLPKAETYFRRALKLDQRLSASHYGLAQVLRQQARYPEALPESEATAKLEPRSPSAHYLLGQVLLKAGREAEGRRELAIVRQLQQSARDDLQRKISGSKISETAAGSESF